MGTWEVGLYSSDTALDLRSIISTVIKLPFDDEKILDIIYSQFDDVYQNEKDEDYTIFWLVLADQFHKKGINNKTIFDKALEIIDSDKDLKMFKELGADESSLIKRSKKLQELKLQLLSPITPKKLKKISKPQTLILHTGDLVLFPVTKDGSCYNPYFNKHQREKYPHIDFDQHGWGAALIISGKLYFEYYACYQAIICQKEFTIGSKPTLNSLLEEKIWSLDHPGTCSKTHFERMELEIIGNIEIDENKANRNNIYQTHISSVTSDISIANRFRIGKSLNKGIVIYSIKSITR